MIFSSSNVGLYHFSTDTCFHFENEQYSYQTHDTNDQLTSPAFLTFVVSKYRIIGQIQAPALLSQPKVKVSLLNTLNSQDNVELDAIYNVYAILAFAFVNNVMKLVL